MTTYQESGSGTGTGQQLVAKGAILLAFIVALEIVIMISPFAMFFYAVFNPFLLALASLPSTRWLTAFFLPHMIAPPDVVLATIRVLGSICFVLGLLVFLGCAIQVYAGKMWKAGVARTGLYAVIRHPQYVGLGLSGIGLAILWPRFLTLVLLAVMLSLYYVLAKDEERRMLGRHGEGYRAYMHRTGMFVPRRAGARPTAGEAELSRIGYRRAAGVFAVLLVGLVASGFVLREYTIRHLPLVSVAGVDAIAITAEDAAAARGLIPSVLEDPAVAAQLSHTAGSGHRLLSYVIPIDYTMQGMIADTGGEWRLFERHETLPMITDYMLHPFGHLTGGHAHASHAGTDRHDSPALKRRLVFIDVWSDARPLTSARDDFAINLRRRPLFFADVHLHTGEVLQVKSIPDGSGWGLVPTPTF